MDFLEKIPIEDERKKYYDLNKHYYPDHNFIVIIYNDPIEK